MSAPDTNVEKQTRRHKGPLIGMVVGLIIVGALIFTFVGRGADEAGNVAPNAAEAESN